MRFSTGKQEKPPKFVKKLRPNPTMNLLKEAGGLNLLLKEAVIYNFLFTYIWWGRVIGRWGKEPLLLLWYSPFSFPAMRSSCRERVKRRRKAPAITPSPCLELPGGAGGGVVVAVLSALARGHSLAFCSSCCLPPKQFARSMLTCFQRGTKQFTDNEANRAYTTSQPSPQIRFYPSASLPRCRLWASTNPTG